MTLTDRPSFSELSRHDCVELLRRNHVGRIAFTFHDRVDIEPISYVFADDWLYGRTSPGTKVATVRHHGGLHSRLTRSRAASIGEASSSTDRCISSSQTAAIVSAKRMRRQSTCFDTSMPTP